MKKKIRNYTTNIPASTTIGEIQVMLAKSGATGIAMDYDGQGNIKALFFRIVVGNKEMPFKLPAKPEAVYEVLHAHKQGEETYREQRMQNSIDVAWRIVKDWLETQLTLVDLQQAEMAEIFFPYLVVGNNKTLYESSKEMQFENLLPSGK